MIITLLFSQKKIVVPGIIVKVIPGGTIKSFKMKYGPRIAPNVLEDWSIGRYFINMGYDKYLKWLDDKYDKPFDEIQPVISPDLVKPLD